MSGLRDILNVPKPGEVITSDFLSRLADFATQGNVPPGGIQDATGSYSPTSPLAPYWRLARTAANPEEGPYPKAEDQPNTYWFYFLNIDLTTTPLQSGQAAPTFENSTEAMGLVHWLGNRYVPEGTIIRVWYIAPGRTPIYPDSRSDMWIAFDQQQVAGFVTFTLKDPLAKNQETVTAIFDEFWDGQQPWNDTDNPEKEFNLVNTALMFPWEADVASYPAGTKGSACLDPESTKIGPLSYRIIFMSYPADDSDSDSDDSDDRKPLTICMLGCGYWDSENCYNVPELQMTFPAGTTVRELRRVRLFPCDGSDPSEPSEPSEPSDSSAGPDVDAECGVCLDGTMPGFLLLSPSGMANGTCDHGTQLNLYDYYAPVVPDYGPPACWWRTSANWICSKQVLLNVNMVNLGGHIHLSVQLSIYAEYTAYFLAVLDEPPIDCSVIDVWADLQSQIGDFFDASNAKIRVRSVS